MSVFAGHHKSRNLRLSAVAVGPCWGAGEGASTAWTLEDHSRFTGCAPLGLMQSSLGFRDSNLKNMLGNLKDAVGGGTKEAARLASEGLSMPLEHTPLDATQYRTVCRAETPLQITSQGIACFIKFQDKDGHVFIETISNGKLFSQDIVNPLNRHTKAVSGFIYKGLIGIHVHSDGVLLALDEEENFQGKARHNQPPADIISVPLDDDEVSFQRAKRIASFDLSDCSEDNPVIISPNNPKRAMMHMVIRPLEEGSDEFHVILSSAKGKTTDRALATFPLKVDVPTIIDRNLFSSMVEGGGGQIDARTWGMEMRDPVLASVTLRDDGGLIIEEMYTTEGITVVYGEEAPRLLGGPDPQGVQEGEEKPQGWLNQILTIRETMLKGVVDAAHDSEQESSRSGVIDKVRLAMRMETDDGVSRLAYEMALKEVLASLYGGSETATKIDDRMIQLIQSVVSKSMRKLEMPEARNVAVQAVGSAIDRLQDHNILGPWTEDMHGFLPEMEEVEGDAGVDGEFLGSLIKNAKKNLSSGKNTRKLRIKRDELKGAEEESVRAEKLTHDILMILRPLVTSTLEKSLVRLITQVHLPSIEKLERLEYPIQSKGQGSSSIQLGKADIDNILSRADAYSEYMDISFNERIKKPLISHLKAAQMGDMETAQEPFNTKGYLTFLIAMRTSGGNLTVSNDSPPAVSPLMVLPFTIPEIKIMGPEDTPDHIAAVDVSHRNKVVARVPFETDEIQENVDIPAGMPRDVWYTFVELSTQIMGFYLAGLPNKRDDRERNARVASGLTREIVKKLINFARGRDKKGPVVDFTEFDDVVRGPNFTARMVPGETATEEVLDYHERPPHLVESALNLKKALKAVVMELHNEKVLVDSSYRFRTQMRSFATAGGPSDQVVSLPVRIEMGQDTIYIRAKINDDKFEKTLRLPPKAKAQETESEPEQPPVSEAVEPEETEAPVEKKPATPVRKAVPKKSPLQPLPLRYPLSPKELPIDLRKLRIARHGSAIAVLALDEQGQVKRVGGKVQGRKVGENASTIGQGIRVHLEGSRVVVSCAETIRWLEQKIRENRSDGISIPFSGPSHFIEVIVPRKKADDLVVQITVNDEGALRTSKSYLVHDGVVCLARKGGNPIPIVTCIMSESGNIRVKNRIKGNIVVKSGPNHYPVSFKSRK